MRFICLLLVVFLTACSGNAEQSCQLDKIRSVFPFEVSILREVSIEHVEGRLKEKSLRDRFEIILSRDNADWREVKSQLKTGDCLVYYSSHDDVWNSLAGRAGYALFRNNKFIVQYLVGLS